MKAFWDEVQLAHAPTFFLQRGEVRPYLETPGRAEALLQGSRAFGLEIAVPPPAEPEAIRAVHDAEYLDFLREAPGLWAAQAQHGADVVANVHPAPEMLAIARKPASIVGRLGWYTADTSCPMTTATYAAAIASASCALAAADEAAAGRPAYALCRPPGHHAYPARAGGHCYLNNAAIAAERLRSKGAARVGVLDIDAHHGNGTQAIFWDRADVVFASVHGDPADYYPFYVGHAQERGIGAGEGGTLNLPLARDAGDTEWLAAVRYAVEFISACGIDALIVSLGFDASVSEPLHFLSVTDDGFARAGAAVATLHLAPVLVQEGGYDTQALARLLIRFLDGLAASH